MRENSLAILVALIFFLSMIDTYGDNLEEGRIVNPLTCNKTKGEITKKEQTNEGYILYVDLLYDEKWEGYRVYVSEETFYKYEENYTYEEYTCDFFEYRDIGVLIENLTEWGVIQPY